MSYFPDYLIQFCDQKRSVISVLNWHVGESIDHDAGGQWRKVDRFEPRERSASPPRTVDVHLIVGSAIHAHGATDFAVRTYPIDHIL